MSESQPGQPSDTADMNSDAPLAENAVRGMEKLSRDEAAPFELSQEPFTPEGAAAGSVPAAPAPAYEHLGELPATYHTQSVYLVAYDPKQLFAYWDVDWSGGPATPYALHVCRADGSLEQKAEIAAAEAGKYLPVRHPGGTYFVELGRYGRDGGWQVIATSGNVTMPPAGLAGETEPKFATLPFHLSFQRLLELIQETMGRGEDLTAALARLQRGDQSALDTLAGTLSRLGPEPLQTLEALLGQKFHVSSGDDGSSPTSGHLHRDRHDVLAASAFASEGLSSADLSSGRGFGSSSEVPPGAGSETLSSGGFSSLPLTRGISAGMSSENLASGGFSSGVLGGLGGGSEMLAAYAAGLNSESLFSFAGGSGSGGFGGGGSDLHPDERAAQLLKALERQLGMLGGLFGGSGSGGFGGSER